MADRDRLIKKFVAKTDPFGRPRERSMTKKMLPQHSITKRTLRRKKY